MSTTVTVEVTSAAHWRDMIQQTITFKSIEPFLEAGVNPSSLALKAYRGGPTNTFFVVAGKELVTPGRIKLQVELGAYANMKYLGKADIEPVVPSVLSTPSKAAPSQPLLNDDVDSDSSDSETQVYDGNTAKKVEVETSTDSDLVLRIKRLEDEVSGLNTLLLSMAKLIVEHVSK